jgi:hypothetical protein
VDVGIIEKDNIRTGITKQSNLWVELGKRVLEVKKEEEKEMFVFKWKEIVHCQDKGENM